MTSERFLYPVSPANRPDEAGLRATVERLARIERPPCSPGEREAAHLIADRLRGLGAAARVEEVPAYGSYAWPVGALTGLAVLAALAGGRSRPLGALGAAVAAAGIAGDAGPGRRVARALLSRRRTACNVVAGVGDRSARRTLVVIAHHDAAPSGRVYDQRPVRWAARRLRLPRLAGRAAPCPPVWWPVLAGPVLVALGAATGLTWVRRAGGALSALATAALADIGARRAVPGANDALSGVSVLVALAEAARRRPLSGLRVILLSAGAEEALQEGVRGFARRHFPDLAHDATWFLDLQALGSGELVLPRTRGPLRGGPFDPDLGDLISRCAAEQGIGLQRVPRPRADGAATVPARHGYPAACLVSVDEQGLIPHYHLPSDVPEHVDYRCVADAAQLTEAVARALAAR
ncbi:M28 family peptidase [Spirillospora sp. NBC_01491]|uniref:M28 family peptidase n=1 Tax=Spirillospora sp. NBC_01491 TaxID=2976007 RepID=UPI002E3298A7|nr:M28 family peptidase [Spirillospora sp. NBC_01491]